ncbi:MAG TPA: hypothetical protein DCS93_26105 [Microscillaceae bacterium]|nr:hypothetical protein [Microscillaceae bacterium]
MTYEDLLIHIQQHNIAEALITLAEKQQDMSKGEQHTFSLLKKEFLLGKDGVHYIDRLKVLADGLKQHFDSPLEKPLVVVDPDNSQHTSDEEEILQAQKNKYFKNGDLLNTIKTLQQLNSLNPQNLAYWNELAIVYIHQKQYPAAQEILQKALVLHPELAEGWANLGLVWGFLDNYHQAQASFQKALTIDPNNSLYWEGLGKSFAALKKLIQAKECFRKAIELNPANNEAWQWLEEVEVNLRTLYKSKSL